MFPLLPKDVDKNSKRLRRAGNDRTNAIAKNRTWKIVES